MSDIDFIMRSLDSIGLKASSGLSARTFKQDYLMESSEEIMRLERKTKEEDLMRQALWAGIAPGMRVIDVGCGPGKSTALLHRLAQPGGAAVGVDVSDSRIGYARQHYGKEGIEFVLSSVTESLEALGFFDFVWIRFLLEYFREEAFDIVANLHGILKPGGILCLIDLDYNCLSHFPMPERLSKTLFELMMALETCSNFDPFAGRRLYHHLYRLGCRSIRMDLHPHHLIYGELGDIDATNWMMKGQVAAKRAAYSFGMYPGGLEEFLQDFRAFFEDPARFTYTPLICAVGVKQ